MDYNLSNNYEAMYHGAVNAAVQYLMKHKYIKTLIIGVSGGIDSAVVCMLARAACDMLKERKVTLIGRSISIVSNTVDEENRAGAIGECFCHEFKHKNPIDGWRLFANSIERNLGSLPSDADKNLKIRAGNSKARYRMAYLYNLASKHDGLVLGTDNLTEYMLGFWTLHGDVGDFGLIQNLWKTEVYGLANWWASKLAGPGELEAMTACIAAAPTDGLGITDSDLDQLLPHGYNGLLSTTLSKPDHLQGYRQVDNTLIDYLTIGTPHSFPKSSIRHDSVIRRHLLTEFKRDNPASVDRKLLVI